MKIGYNEEIKTLDEALKFDDSNFFEYIFYILNQRNCNWIGPKADFTINKLNAYIKSLPNSDDIIMIFDDLVMQAMLETSEYAYKAGFKEACRLTKTLDSF